MKKKEEWRKGECEVTAGVMGEKNDAATEERRGGKSEWTDGKEKEGEPKRTRSALLD